MPVRSPGPPSPAPLVTVVTATYNWSSVLRYAIASVRAQHYPRWEMVVVGDGCTDDSEEVVRALGDARVRWIGREENSGSQSAPNNDGIAAARGELIAYLGHDDLWTPDHLSRLVHTAKRKGADVAFSLTEMIGPPGSGLRTLSGVTGRGGYRGGHLPPTGLLHRAGMAAEIGGWRDYREIYDPPDVDFTERALAAGNSFACSGALTAFKLPSAVRPGSYRERRCDEQAELSRRIASERLLRPREIARVLAARARNGHNSFAIPGVRPGERGAQVKAARRIRGLE